MENISHSMIGNFTILWRIAQSMITVKDHHTGRLFDPWDHLGPKRRKLLDTRSITLMRSMNSGIMPWISTMNRMPVNTYLNERFGRTAGYS